MAVFRVRDGDLSVVDSPPAFDPATLLLVTGGRIGHAAGRAKGRLLAWGRKP